MGRGPKGIARAACAAASALLIGLALNGWAVSRAAGAAHLSFDSARQTLPLRSHSNKFFAQAGAAASGNATLPAAVRFHEVEGRGLIVRAWLNGAGPFDFAVDTGAGATIISGRAAAAARVSVSTSRTVNLGGLSGARGSVAREATLRSLAVGDNSNRLPGRGLVIVADSLPEDLDGVLDPTESFQPLGYVIDFPSTTIRAFDPLLTPLRRGDAPSGGAVVEWLTGDDSRRPFVQLAEGRRALVDTGSGFGLAVTAEAARSLGIFAGRGREHEGGVRDLGRGRVDARRVAPATVHIGALELRGVPTDVLSGASHGAPVLLGRDALRPFALTFDPVNRLIRFAPVRRQR